MSFTIFLNSTSGTRITAGTNNQIQYNFDYAVASQHTGQFKLSYSFLSQGGMTLTSSDILTISIDELSASMNNYNVGAEPIASKSSAIGWINNDRFTPTDCFYYKNYDDVSPVIIQSLPVGNRPYTITLRNSSTGALDTKITTTPYSLFLHFEAI
jgi:hypothetical protein